MEKMVELFLIVMFFFNFADANRLYTHLHNDTDLHTGMGENNEQRRSLAASFSPSDIHFGIFEISVGSLWSIDISSPLWSAEIKCSGDPENQLRYISTVPSLADELNLNGENGVNELLVENTWGFWVSIVNIPPQIRCCTLCKSIGVKTSAHDNVAITRWHANYKIAPGGICALHFTEILPLEEDLLRRYSGVAVCGYGFSEERRNLGLLDSVLGLLDQINSIDWYAKIIEGSHRRSVVDSNPLYHAYTGEWFLAFSPLDSDPSKICHGAVHQFDAGWGYCATYAAGTINHHYCKLDFDSWMNVYAYEACSECNVCDDAAPKKCLNERTWNAGYGDCSTYAHRNKQYCGYHYARGFYAGEVCRECGTCKDDAETFCEIGMRGQSKEMCEEVPGCCAWNSVENHCHSIVGRTAVENCRPHMFGRRNLKEMDEEIEDVPELFEILSPEQVEKLSQEEMEEQRKILAEFDERYELSLDRDHQPVTVPSSIERLDRRTRN